MTAEGRLAGRVALVTGASRGLGAAIVRLFAQEGAAVLLTDVLDAEGEGLAGELAADGAAVAYQRLDVREPEAWRLAVERAEREFGGLHVLVNNAGIGGHGSIAELTLEAWQERIAINQTGAFLGIKHAVPALRRAGGGAIVNVSSICGLVAIPGVSAAYTATKGAVRLLSKSAAVEFAPDRIRVNSVHPGRIETPMIVGADEAFEAAYRAQTPLGRNATPEEIAYGVLYLACDEAAYVTGAELVIDGGLTAR
ncbi:MAG TPA: glucose 1-dehydrogenase [Gemmatimonadaceae bacterium]|nr:glucose 1-dehydrogenase [Gemmatimonadaceae bacterium]